MRINALMGIMEKKLYDRTSAICVGRWENILPCVFAEDFVEGGEGLCDTPYEELYRGEDGGYFIYGNRGIATPMIYGIMNHLDDFPFEAKVLPLNDYEAEVWAARFLTLEECEAGCEREMSEYDKVCAAMDRDICLAGSMISSHLKKKKWILNHMQNYGAPISAETIVGLM